MLAQTNICSFFIQRAIQATKLGYSPRSGGTLQILRPLGLLSTIRTARCYVSYFQLLLRYVLSSHRYLHPTGTMESEDCKRCSATHPCPRHSSCCIKGSKNKKEKGGRYMTYDPHRCMLCKAYIAESESGFAAAQEELRKHLMAIRGHRQRSHCPSSELMDFFSSEEEAIRLLALAHYTPPSPHTRSRASSVDPQASPVSPTHSEASLQHPSSEARHSSRQASPTALPSTSLQKSSRKCLVIFEII